LYAVQIDAPVDRSPCSGKLGFDFTREVDRVRPGEGITAHHMI
jgi:hypothetical protein